MSAAAPPRPTTDSLIAASGGSVHEFNKANRKMRWWYESLADYMIAHPQATQNEIGLHFGRTPTTISTIIHTDAFKAYYRQRRANYTEQLDAGVRDKLFKLADKSLDQMLATLEKKRDTIPLESLQRASDMALKNLGYGIAAPASTTVNVNTAPTVSVAVSLDDLTRAREALRRNQLAPTIEHNPEEAGLARGATGLGETSNPALEPGRDQVNTEDAPMTPALPMSLKDLA
jgi:hypothetical protein